MTVTITKSILTTAILLGLSTSVSAEQLGKVGHTVSFDMDASQLSLRDNGLNDTFKIGITSPDFALAKFEVECSAGSSGAWFTFGFARTDETCKVSGNASIVNPNNGQEIPRMQYAGGYKVIAEQDGFADMRTIAANYIAVGSAPAQNGTFGGSAMLMPENPSKSASELLEKVVSHAKESATGADAIDISTEMDSIRLDSFVVPNAGGRGTVDCTWTGDMLYAYANDAWQMNLTANCGGDIYQLEGNMPWIDVEDKDHNAEYVLNLMMAGKGGNDPFAAADPFAEVEGIVGTINMTQSGLVEVQISENETDDLPTKIVANATFTGNGVPVDLTYSFAQIIALYSRTFFGA